MIELGKRYYTNTPSSLLNSLKKIFPSLKQFSSLKQFYLNYLSYVNELSKGYGFVFIILFLIALFFLLQTLLGGEYVSGIAFSISSIYLFLFLLVLSFPFLVVSYLVLSFNIFLGFHNFKGGWSFIFQQDYFIANYLHKRKKIPCQDIVIAINPYADTLIYSPKHKYSLYTSSITREDWKAFARKQKIRLRFDYDRLLIPEFIDTKEKESKWVNLVKDLEDENKKIELKDWQGYLEKTPSITFKNKTKLENFSELQAKEEEISNYYEWREKEKLIGFVEYEETRGTVLIEMIEEKFHLVEEMAKDLEAEIDDFESDLE